MTANGEHHDAQLRLSAAALAAFERRGSGVQGALRVAWEARLQQRRAAFARLLDGRAQASSPTPQPLPPSPFPILLARLQAGGQCGGSAPTPGAAPGTATAQGAEQADSDLKALRLFAPRWAQLRLEARLSAALAGLPAAAGPLNSHHLMAQALRTLQACAPAYLQHFLAWGEGLSRLEQATAPLLPGKSAGSARRRSRARG